MKTNVVVLSGNVKISNCILYILRILEHLALHSKMG